MSIIDEIVEHDRQRAGLSLVGATGVNPDAAAKAEQHARELGLPPETAQRNPAMVERQVRTQRAVTALQAAPSTTRFVSDPRNAAVAHDQVEGLALMEQFWGEVARWATRRPSKHTGRLEDLLARRGAEFIAGTIEGSGDIVDLLGMTKGVEDGFGPNPGGRITRMVAKPFREGARQIAPPRGTGETVVDAFGSVLAAIGAARAGRIAPGYAFGAGGVSRQLDRAEQQGKARDSGVETAALATGVTEGALGQLGFEASLGRFAGPLLSRLGVEARGQVARGVAGLVTGAAGEGATEAAQQVAENLLTRYGIDPKQPVGEGVIESLWIGALVGGTVSAPAAVLEHVAQADAQLQAAEQAPDDAARFDRLVERVRESPLPKRAPDRFEEWAAEVTGNQPVYISADAVRKFLQSGKPEDTDALAHTTIPEQLETAVGPGADVVVPAGVYLARIAPTVAHEALKGDLRLSPDAMSLNEAQGFDAEGFVKEQGERLAGLLKAPAEDPQLAKLAERAAVEAKSAGDVHARVLSELVAAGIARSNARLYADLYARRYATRGRLFGETAEQAFARAGPGGGVRVRGEQGEDFADAARDSPTLGALRDGDALAALKEAQRIASGAPTETVRALILRLRAGKREDVKPGPSLLQFIASQGGIKDEGGELAAMDADVGRVGRHRIGRQGGLTLGDMMQRAIDAGYFHHNPGEDTADNYQADPQELLSAIRDELQGRKRYVEAGEPDTEFDALDETLTRLGIDVDTATLAEINKALDEYARSFEQPAYHGSPHIFDKFRLDESTIGTGEGAQAFGHGLYFAGRREVAEYYRDALAGRSDVLIDGQNILDFLKQDADALRERAAEIQIDVPVVEGVSPENAEKAVRSWGWFGLARAIDGVRVETVGDAATRLDAVAKRSDETRALMEREGETPIDIFGEALVGAYARALAKSNRIVVDRPGRLYEVEIPEADEYLDWDKPLGEQSDHVKAALRKVGAKLKATGWTPGDHIDTLAAGHAHHAKDPAINIDGQTLYRELSKALAQAPRVDEGNGWSVVVPTHYTADAAASAALREAGIAGIRYLDGSSRSAREGHHNYVVFDDSRIEIRSFEQPARGEIVFHGQQAIIRLLKGHDLSTFLHETGHLWLEEVVADAQREDAPDSLKADLQTVLDWMGVQAADQIETRHHEQFARAVEAYLMEGQAPSNALQRAFRRFKGWLSSIYGTAKALDVTVSPELRDVLDRLLATEAEIAAVRMEDGGPIFATAKDGGMTEAEHAAYLSALEEKDAQHREKLLARAMRDIRRQRKAAWKEEYASVEAKAAAEVDARSEVRAFHLLTKGELLGSADQPGKVKLSREGLAEVFGKDVGQRYGLIDTLPRGSTGKDGLHPDNLAEMVGAASGEKLIRDLVELERLRKERGDVRKALTRDAAMEEMRARHGDMLDEGAIEAEALDVIHDDSRSKVLGIELSALQRLAQDERPLTKEQITAWAGAQIAALRPKELRSGGYLRAERQAGKEAQRALLKGDHAKALEHKRQQVLNFHLYRHALDAEKEIASIAKRFDRYARQDYPSIEIGYRDQIHHLLEQHGFRDASEGEVEARRAFAAWVAERETEGEALAFTPEDFASARDPDSLTVEEVRALNDAIENLAHLGREARKVLVGNEKRDRAEAIQEAIDRASALPSKPVNLRPGRAREPKDMPAHLIRGLDSSLRKIEDLAEYLDHNDPRGIWHRILIEPATDAANLKGQLQRDIADPIGKAFWEIPLDTRKGYTATIGEHPLIVETPEGPQPLSLRRGDLIAVALNTGNASNLSKLAEGYQTTPEAIFDLLDRYLTKPEWDFVQHVWDTLDKQLWPLVAQNERKLSGLMPEKVVPVPVRTPFGEYRGGYYPAAYDPTFDDGALQRERRGEADLMGQRFRNASTPKGFTKSRTSYTGPLLLSVDGVLIRHLDDVMTRVAYAEFVQSARRFILDPKVKALVTLKMGEEYYDQFMPWLQSQVLDQPFAARHLRWPEAFARRARINWQICVMGFSINTGITQLAGLSASAGVIGPKWVGHGLVKAARLWSQGKIESFVFARSEEMRQRNVELDRDLRDALKSTSDMAVGASMRERALGKFQRLAMFHIGFMDRYTVAIPTWVGAFDKAIWEGRSDEDAARIADKAVRKSQSAGRPKDLAAIQRPNSEYVKWITLAYSYFSAQYNRQVEMTRDVKQGRKLQAFSAFFWIMLVSPLAQGLLVGDIPDEGDDPEEWAKWAASKTFFGLFSGVPILRDASNFVDRKVRGEYATAGMTPVARGADAIVKAVSDYIGIAEGDEKPRTIKHTAEAVGFVFGLPGVQVGKTTQYWADVANGEEEPESFLEFIEGTWRGPQ